MALMTVSSANPRFSFAIRKNPSAEFGPGRAPFERPCRSGKILGWFSAPGSYRVLFSDARGTSSFPSSRESSVNYLDKSRFASPAAYCALLAEAFSSAQKGNEDCPAGFSESVDLAAVWIAKPKLAEEFVERFSDRARVVVERMRPKVWSVRFESEQGLPWLLSLVDLFCVLQAIADPDGSMELPEEAVRKRLRGMDRLAAPYFIRKRFALGALRDRDLFNLCSAELSGSGMSIGYGDFRQQRFDAARRHLRGGASFVDLGCAEGWHLVRMSPNYSAAVGVDQDAAVCALAERALARKAVKNASVLNGSVFDLFSGLPLRGSDVLAGEFLEHLEASDASRLLGMLSESGFAKFVATVPNRMFNEHLGGGMRHADHKWEPDEEEWRGLVCSAFDSARFEIVFEAVGDCVGGQSVSLLACVSPR